MTQPIHNPGDGTWRVLLEDATLLTWSDEPFFASASTFGIKTVQDEVRRECDPVVFPSRDEAACAIAMRTAHVEYVRRVRETCKAIREAIK